MLTLADTNNELDHPPVGDTRGAVRPQSRQSVEDDDPVDDQDDLALCYGTIAELKDGRDKRPKRRKP